MVRSAICPGYVLQAVHSSLMLRHLSPCLLSSLQHQHMSCKAAARLADGSALQRMGSKGPLGDFMRTLCGLLSPLILAPAHVAGLIKLAGSEQPLLGAAEVALQPGSNENGALGAQHSVTVCSDRTRPCLVCGLQHRREAIWQESWWSSSRPAPLSACQKAGCSAAVHCLAFSAHASVQVMQVPAARSTRVQTPLRHQALCSLMLAGRRGRLQKLLHVRQSPASWWAVRRLHLGSSAALLAR